MLSILIQLASLEDIKMLVFLLPLETKKVPAHLASWKFLNN